MDGRPYDEAAFAFVDRLAALEAQVAGPANVERFRYWLDFFRYLRAMAQADGHWGDLLSGLKRATAAGVPRATARQMVIDEILPARVSLVNSTQEMMSLLLGIVSTTGQMGTVANLQQHSLIDVLNGSMAAIEELVQGKLECAPDAELGCWLDCPRVLPKTVTINDPRVDQEWCATQCQLAGYPVAGVEFGVACFCGMALPATPAQPLASCHKMRCTANASEWCGSSCLLLAYNFTCTRSPSIPDPPAIPAAAYPSQAYLGRERLFVLSPRTWAGHGEQLALTAITMRATAADPAPTLYVRPLGSSAPYTPHAMLPVKEGRQVYRVTLQATSSFEYVVNTTSSKAGVLTWPAGAPHTVVVSLAPPPM